MQTATEAPGPGITPTRASKPALRTRATWWALAFVLGIHTVLVVGQPIFAGSLLAGNADAITFHEVGGELVHLTCFVQVVVSVLFWRPGRGPGWPALATLGLVVAEGAQIGFGEKHLLAVHVPLGVAIVGSVVAFLVWAIRWRISLARTTRASASAR
jgi:hypothetical protein